MSLADEKTIGVMGLTDTIRYSSVQFARGSENGQTILYLDHYLNMNSQSFEVFRIQYSDRLQVSGGVRCYEFEGAAGCDTGAFDKALEELNTGGLSSKIYDCCTSRPAACWTMTGGGAVTELCGFFQRRIMRRAWSLPPMIPPGCCKNSDKVILSKFYQKI